MRFMRHIIPLNKTIKRLICLSLLGSVFFISSCATVSETFMQDNTTIYIGEDIEKEARVETPLVGGQINIAMPTNPTSFNPLKGRNINMINIYTLVFESPLIMDVNGVIRANVVENWNVDASGMVWTFHLRKNIMWHNGLGEMTAEDLVYTLDLIMSYTPEESIFARYNKRIGDYYAQDKYTFVLNAVDPTIKASDTQTKPKPSSYIEYMMTFPVLCKQYYEKSDNVDTTWPIGSGAYEFTSYQQEQGIRLDVNDDWWKRKPYIASIVAKPIPDAASEIVAYANQDIDLVGTSDRSANRYRKYGVTNVEEYMTQYYDCLVPNLYPPKDGTIKFIHDIRARQAIAHALDKSQIISKGLINHAVATDVPVPPDSWLFDASLDIYEHNQNQAIQLLEEMGYTEFDENGFRMKANADTGEIEPLVVEIMYPKEINDSYKINIASLIEEQLEAVGINVELRELPSTSFDTKVENASFDIALVSFFIDRNPDPKFMLHSSRSTANYGYFEDEYMDTALEECGIALTDEDKKASFSKVQDEFIKQLPQIPLYFMTNSLIYDYSIKGISNYRSLNIFRDIQSWYVVSEVQ
jgi:peptide/nickel transport system substrate-binding protein